MTWESIVNEFNKTIVIISGAFLTLSVGFAEQLLALLPGATYILVISWFFVLQSFIFVFYSFGNFTKYLMGKDSTNQKEKDEAYAMGDTALKYCNYGFRCMLASLACFLVLGVWLVVSKMQ